MQKVIHSTNIKTALQARGWTQKDLAAQLGVTGQAITNWMKGTDFPRPDKLLKLATTLKLGFADLVQMPQAEQPVVAFRKKGGAKTTDEHISKAMAMGALLKALVPFLPTLPQLRRQVPNPSTEYKALQAVVAQVRSTLGLTQGAVLHYEALLGEFVDNGAVVVPVMWGTQKSHKNALHILLPQERATFILLNLDTYLEDFKFWMAHELAHVYTPELAGKEEGEDFADAFAGALLFPMELARTVYEQVSGRNKTHESRVLQEFAAEHGISLFSVFEETNRFARAHGLSPLKHEAVEVHAMRNAQRGRLVSELLFAPLPPEPLVFIAAAEKQFKSPVFQAMRRMVTQQGTGPGYLQQVMDIPMQDAVALHKELAR
ncbi:helix-turn-helix transcriptional regulator [Curvibacter fontanus]|jgi:transcriptional regulator with XRE-family HTH domain